MTDQLMRFFEYYKDKMGKPKKVLDIGSLIVDEKLPGAGKFFRKNATEYVGLDLTEGEGVNHIGDMHKLTEYFPEGYFDLVICTEVLEHDPTPLVTIEQMRTVLKKGGYLLVSVPFRGEYHPYPKDYWRFMLDAWTDYIFKDYMVVELEEVGSAYAGFAMKL